MKYLNKRGNNEIILPNYKRLEIKKTADGYKTFVSNRVQNIEMVLP